MTPHERQTIGDLLAGLCDRSLLPDEMRRLDELICTDGEARRLYVEYLDLHARLVWQFHQLAETSLPAVGPAAKGARQMEPSHGAAIPAVPAAGLEPRAAAGGQDQMTADLPALPAAGGICPPVPQASLTTYPFLSGGVLASYLFAGALLAAGILAALLASGVSGDRDVAGGPRPSWETLPGADAQPRPIVGYVTNVPSCKWADAGPAPTLGAPVLLGRTFALASGALEITYDTGERITLHGPATFEARWFNGGFLSEGQASVQATTVETADREPLERQRLEVYDKIAAAPHPPGNRYSPHDPVGNFSIPMSSFFVRTPSALAMSRGAEFSLSVDATGATSTRLATGLIEAWYPRGGKPNDTISSSAHQAWSWVAFTSQHDVRVLYGTGNGARGLANGAGRFAGARRVRQA